jgi:hypothetical protein
LVRQSGVSAVWSGNRTFPNQAPCKLSSQAASPSAITLPSLPRQCDSITPSCNNPSARPFVPSFMEINTLQTPHPFRCPHDGPDKGRPFFHIAARCFLAICSTELSLKIIGMRGLDCLLKREYSREQKNFSLIYHKLVILCQ